MIFTLNGTRPRDPAITRWIADHKGDLGAIAKHWFNVLRACGPDVREILHDGRPTACVGNVAFAYVDAHKAHVSVGFFRGAELVDPYHLLEGKGRSMRHVKIAPSASLDEGALSELIYNAYSEIKGVLME